MEFLFAIFNMFRAISNHYHLVVYVDLDEASTWNDEEVCKRWQQLYQSHPLVNRLQKGQCSCQAEADTAKDIIN